MAAFRPNITDKTDAVLKTALQLLSQAERMRLTQLLGEFDSGQASALSANAVTDLATAAGVLVGVTEFATALNSNAWHAD